ncbi:MAG: DUF2442 domain-containing protein [Chlamydiales bacterium]
MDYGDPTKFVINRVVNLSPFYLEIFFRDGKSQRIDFAKVELEKWQKPLEDIDYFNQFSINESGFLEWPNGEDFPADHLYYWEEYREEYEKRDSGN